MSRWLDAMNRRPACHKGIEVPYREELPLDDEETMEAFAERVRSMVVWQTAP